MVPVSRAEGGGGGVRFYVGGADLICFYIGCVSCISRIG